MDMEQRTGIPERGNKVSSTTALIVCQKIHPGPQNKEGHPKVVMLVSLSWGNRHGSVEIWQSWKFWRRKSSAEKKAPEIWVPEFLSLRHILRHTSTGWHSIKWGQEQPGNCEINGSQSLHRTARSLSYSQPEWKALKAFSSDLRKATP